MPSKKNPWILIDSVSIYKNNWMEVKEDKVIRPDKKNSTFGIVKLKSGVTVLPIDERENVFLVKQYRYVMKKNTLEAVSGGIEKKEKPIDAAKRELKEEAGIEAGKWISLGKINPLTSVVNSQNHLFLATNLKLSNSNQDKTENIELVKITLNKAVDLVINNKISSSVTTTLILKSLTILRNKSTK